MSSFAKVLQRLQDLRLTARLNSYSAEYLQGIEDAEAIIYEEQENIKRSFKISSQMLWHKGIPTDSGDYVLIMRSNFDSEDGVVKDKIYISADYWDGEEFQMYEFGMEEWELLYFAKLNWFRFPIPQELGIRKNASMFIK